MNRYSVNPDPPSLDGESYFDKLKLSILQNQLEKKVKILARSGLEWNSTIRKAHQEPKATHCATNK